jgi:hypothetical protein
MQVDFIYRCGIVLNVTFLIGMGSVAEVAFLIILALLSHLVTA